MTTYYKATRCDGTDFFSGTIHYEVGKVVEHPTSKRYSDTKNDRAATYLSVSTVPTDCTGMRWPCRLFAVEGIGRARRHVDYPNKRGFRAVRVVEELPATDALGPQGVEVAALIERARSLTVDETRRLETAWAAARAAAAWDAAWDAAWAAAWDAGRAAAWAAVRDAPRAAVWDAAGALVVRDLITPEQFDVLYGPWRRVVEEQHS